MPNRCPTLTKPPPPTPRADTPGALPLTDRRNRLIWLNNDRVFYAGLLGDVTLRTMGGWLVYVSLGAPIRMALGDAASGLPPTAGAWQTTDLAVLPPYTAHRVACDERLICAVTIEPETVDAAALPGFMRGQAGAVPADVPGALQTVQRVRAVHAWLRNQGRQIELQTASFDACVFGQPLAPRCVDARIARVLDDIRNDPSRPTTAQDCAAAAGLSFSRFLHLFKAEVGTPFRSLRTWKRARSLLHHVSRGAPLVDVALGACRAWGVEAFTQCGVAKIGPSEDSFCRVRRLIAIAMGQEADEKWTAAVNLQPTLPKSDRLPGALISREADERQICSW